MFINPSYDTLARGVDIVKRLFPIVNKICLNHMIIQIYHEKFATIELGSFQIYFNSLHTNKKYSKLLQMNVL